jgi:hypothetical protein
VKRDARPVIKPERKLIELTLVTKMEKTPESVAAEIAALRHSLSEVTAAIDKYAEIATQNVGNKDSTASGDVSESHKALFPKTSKLLTTVRGPVDMVISNFENVRIPSNARPLTGKINGICIIVSAFRMSPSCHGDGHFPGSANGWIVRDCSITF